MDESKQNEHWEPVLEAAFREHYKFLYREARKSLMRQDAEDVVQDVYIRLAQAEFQPEIRSNPKQYLRRAVVNACTDFLRRRNRRKKDPDLEDVRLPAPGTDTAGQNVRDQLEQAFALMSGEVEEIVRLHCVEGYSDQEIADRRGQKRSRIASILSRSRERIKEAAGRNKEKRK